MSTTTRERFRPPDHPHDHFLLTTTVGSYPKPKWLDRLHDRREGERTAEDEPTPEWTESVTDATRLITAEHERCGLDVVGDGEVRRREMVEHFAHRTDGIEFHGPVKVWGHNCFCKPSVVDPIERSEPWLLEEFEVANEAAERPVKVPITGPYTLARFSFDEVYGDTEALALEYAALVAETVERLVDAGARYVQIDEPALSQVPDDHEIVGACLERIVRDVPDDVRVGLHVCYGDYSRLYPEVLEFPIDEFDVELLNGEYDQLEVFTEPEFTLDFAIGVVDNHDATVESVAEIKENIRQGLRVVPPERLTVSPDCGLKLLPRDVAAEKLENMVRAARELEAELDAGVVDVPDHG
ncbi:methionine synthase [Natronoglomus mannanivorans]|uniref:Methionine synthase n=1 Tax=Natronoglomus mannanivorans TaxID=2979990 RepID=A0AAP3E0I6_9EURY|nr:methionine synthase [Halobacteria archaeon AArc-xg1-1]